MSIKKIIQSIRSGGSIEDEKMLHRVCSPVILFDESILLLIKDLRDTIWAYSICKGLSAPQIGVNTAVSVVNFAKTDTAEDLILINPQIISMGGKKDKKRETCMSVWGYLGEVERRYKIDVQYQDLEQRVNNSSFEGFNARLIQHEVDHLNGSLYYEKSLNGNQLSHADMFEKLTII